MLAVRRMVKVSGRMKNLINSIININGIKRFGVLGGIKWIKKCFFLFIIIIVRMGIHRDRISLNVIDSWDVELHAYIGRAMRLIMETDIRMLSSMVLFILLLFMIIFDEFSLEKFSIRIVLDRFKMLNLLD